MKVLLIYGEELLFKILHKRSREEFEKEVDKLNNSWNKAQETLEIK